MRIALVALCVMLTYWAVFAQETTAPAGPLSASIFKSFYRPDVTVRYALSLPESALAQHRLVATVHAEGQTQALARHEVAPQRLAGEFALPTTALPLGRYAIDLVLTHRQQGEVARTTLLFPVLADPAVTSRLVTVRPSDNMLIVQGKAHFPIGIYETPSSEGYLRMLSQAGFNLVLLHASASPGLPGLLDTLHRNGLRVWIPLSSTLDFSKDADKKRAQLTELAKLAGNHPGLLCWESMDEPVWGKQDAAGYYDGYCFLRQLDQQHPIWTNHAPRNTIAELAHFNRATDIAGVDIYPVPDGAGHSDLPNQTISVTGDETEKNAHALNHQKPVFMVLQGFGWRELSKPEPGHPPVMPTFAQSRFMAYEAIVRGANGILYWGTHYTKKPSQFWSELRALTSELAALQEVLASETRALPVTWQPEAGVRVMHKVTGGFNTLILVNEKPEPTKFSLRTPALKGNRLRRLFEGREYAVQGGKLTIDLAGYDVAVLSDNLKFRDQRQDFSAEWKNAPAPVDLTEPGNAVRNGGFEVDQDGDGMPDDWEVRAPLTASLTADAHSGKTALRLESPGGESAPLAVQRRTEIQAGKRYRFTAWVKTDPAGVEFRFYTEWVTDTFHSHCLPFTKGTAEWTQYAFEFTGEPDPQGGAYVVVQARGKGVVQFDDVRVELVE